MAAVLPVTVPRLPPELFYNIMRQLFHYSRRPKLYEWLYSEKEAEAKDALLACSQVSYAMRQATLPFLFHTIALSITPYFELNYEGCVCHPPSYLADEATSYTAVNRHVRELRMRMRCTAGSCPDDRGDPTEIDGGIFLAFAHRFGRLQIIHMENMDLWWFPPSSVSPSSSLALETFICRAKSAHGSESLEYDLSSMRDTLAALTSSS